MIKQRSFNYHVPNLRSVFNYSGSNYSGTQSNIIFYSTQNIIDDILRRAVRISV